MDTDRLARHKNVLSDLIRTTKNIVIFYSDKLHTYVRCIGICLSTVVFNRKIHLRTVIGYGPARHNKYCMILL